jgi:hypothetical protein
MDTTPTKKPEVLPEPESFRPDELDLPSGVSAFVKVNGIIIQKELTFRELHDFTVKEIKLWDSLETRDRLTVQKHQDPNYRPLQPGEGSRARSSRGRRASAMKRS